MQVGFIGCGQHGAARSRAAGASPCCAPTPAPAGPQALAEELGGEALATNRELAERADVVVLAPQARAARRGGRRGRRARRRRSSRCSARTPLADVRAAYPGAPVFRFVPNTPVELRAGVSRSPSRRAGDDELPARRARAVRARRARSSTCRSALMSSPARCSGVGPAYWALLVEARSTPRYGAGCPPRSRRSSVDRDDGRHRRAAARTATATRWPCAARSPRPAARPPRAGGARARRRPRGVLRRAGRRGGGG